MRRNPRAPSPRSPGAPASSPAVAGQGAPHTAGVLPPAPPERDGRFYRHRLPVRVMHWVNVVCVVVLLMSGLTIFNAHPHLYWGRSSDFARPWLSITAVGEDDAPRGVVQVAGRRFDTDGVLGTSPGVDGGVARRAFPAWLTLPGRQWLSMGRHWHFFFAWLFAINGIAYLAYGLASGHLRHDLAPSRGELGGIGASVVDHLLFRHPRGEAARRYNVLQKLAYLGLIGVLLPLLVLAGWAMSPTLNAVWPGWVDWLGGRQSARTLHFLAAAGLLLFVVVHLLALLAAGPWNHLRSMVTGWYRLPRERAPRRSA